MVDDAARAAEHEIDNAYRLHPLLSFSYEESIRSTFIAVNALLQQVQDSNPHTYAAAVDTVINGLKYAVRWMWDARTQVRLVQPAGDPVRHAKSFILLATEYVGMVAAFLHASDDLINLTLENRMLRVTGALLQQQQYEAYNDLIKSSARHLQSDTEVAISSDERILAAVKSAAIRKISPERVPLDHDVLAVACDVMAHYDAMHHMLPGDWRFSGFSLKAFRAIQALLRAIVYTWSRIAPVLAREPWFVPHAAHQPFAVTRAELLSAASSVCGVSKAEARGVLNVLEYAGSGITSPDPALQALVPLPDGRYLLSDPLIMHTAAERNLTVLLNRIPHDKKIYSRLKNRKEGEMRKRISGRMGTRFRLWYGHLDGHEVDLAIIDDSDQSLLFLELKWFIDPAEVRELRDRSKELEKGVAQSKKLLALTDSPVKLSPMGTGPFHVVGAAVVSANWIGFGNVQDRDIPIIAEEHFVRKVLAASSLSEVITWLRERTYLPVAGRDYAVVERPTRVDKWTLDWYRIEPVNADDFISASTGGQSPANV